MTVIFDIITVILQLTSHSLYCTRNTTRVSLITRSTRIKAYNNNTNNKWLKIFQRNIPMYCYLFMYFSINHREHIIFYRQKKNSSEISTFLWHLRSVVIMSGARCWNHRVVTPIRIIPFWSVVFIKWITHFSIRIYSLTPFKIKIKIMRIDLIKEIKNNTNISHVKR